MNRTFKKILILVLFVAVIGCYFAKREEKTTSLKKTDAKFPPSGDFDISIPKDEVHRVVIIGAGVTALGAAQRLNELKSKFSKLSVVILEENGAPGGLSTSERDENCFLWDKGGHIVNKKSRYEYFVRTLRQAVPHWMQKNGSTSYFMKGSDGVRRFILTPVHYNIAAMDEIDRQKSLEGLEKAAKAAKNTTKVKLKTFEEGLLKTFGEGLSDIFIRKFYRKWWTLDPAKINTAWFGGRTDVPNIAEIKRRISEYDKNKDSTMKNSPWPFPMFGGSGNIWNSVASLLPREWFFFNSTVTHVNLDDERTLSVVRKYENTTTKTEMIPYDTLISTAPIDRLLHMAETTDPLLKHYRQMAASLVYTHTHIVGIGLKGQPRDEEFKTRFFIYFPDNDAPFYRVTIFGSDLDDYVMKPGSQWSLMCEITEPKVSNETLGWTSEYLISETVRALVDYGFISEDMIVSKHYHRLNYGYPIPSLQRDEILNAVQPWLKSKRVLSRGRFGGWRFEASNQDHSFMQGVEAVDYLLQGIREETYFNVSQKSRNRMLNDSLFFLDTHYVISHHNEKLDWLKSLANKITVYHKGKSAGPEFPVLDWKTLPNVGQDVHTYLHHIITNYDSLANITVFVQGHIGTIAYCCSLNAFEEEVCKIIENLRSESQRTKQINSYLDKLLNGKRRRSKVIIPDFYRAIFDKDMPEYAHYCHTGCVAATRANIRKRPKSFYKNAMKFVADYENHNPEEARHLEGLLREIVNPRLAD